jgi:hypothetical protein
VRVYLHVVVAVCILGLAVLPLGCSNNTPNTPTGFRAAIVDQLYLMEPNQVFIDAAKQILESYGFTVDVWQGAQITVDFYRKLPSLGYKFILLRVHSGLLVSLKNGKAVKLNTTYLFTAENYTASRYITDQLGNRVSDALMENNSPLVFAVNSQFIKSAKGKFAGTVVLAMGCESYEYDDLPLAFIDKGASLYIGWSNVVTLDHVDSATLDLLHNLYSSNMTIAQSISKTTENIGKDPYFDSFLKYYPSTSGNLTISDLLPK